MTHAAHPQADMVTDMMTAAVAEEAMAEMIMVDTEDVMIMIADTVDAIVMTMLRAGSTDTPAGTIDTVEEATSDAEVEEDTLIATIGETEMVEDHPAMWLQQLPMVIPLLVEKLESHTEVEATMMKDSPVVNIDR
jgi:hypothetical protein